MMELSQSPKGVGKNNYLGAGCSGDILSVRLKRTFSMPSSVLLKNGGSRALFMGPASFFLAKTTLKLGCPTTLFTHLKIIFLQCFQFSAISSIQTDPKYNS